MNLEEGSAVWPLPGCVCKSWQFGEQQHTEELNIVQCVDPHQQATDAVAKFFKMEENVHRKIISREMNENGS